MPVLDCQMTFKQREDLFSQTIKLLPRLDKVFRIFLHLYIYILVYIMFFFMINKSPIALRHRKFFK